MDLETLRSEVKLMQDQINTSVPIPVAAKIVEYDNRLASIETALQSSEATRVLHVQQLTQSEQTRFAMEAKMGIIEQTIGEVGSWRKTVDSASGNYVLRQ